MKTRSLGLAADVLEKAVLVLLFAWQVFRIWPSLGTSPINLALLVADGLPIWLIFNRREALSVSACPIEWLVAFFATSAPLLLAPGGHAVVPQAAGATLMVAGLLVNIYAKISLWRSFGMVAANRGIQRHGPYRVIRHPMYMGHAAGIFGFLALNPSAANIALVGATLGLQLIRLRAEERLLQHDPAYAAYMIAVPRRLAPGVY
jgi:protein-S-isoprenylcysteine O-methyltransferase Ste14